ncbi:MAG: SDR family oxidoreductase [Anaerolineales bacterium]|nr:SDR family oxidoreductase [Anaerolineales bacterium]
MDIPEVKSLLDFTGRVVLVTGSGGGLGSGIARRFGQAGASVAAHYRSSRAAAEAVARDIEARGGRAAALAADLTDPAAAARLIEAVVTAFGQLDVLINNAGANFPLVSVLDTTPAQWDEMLANNLRSVFLCTQAAARQMIAQGSGGAIVNLTSIEAENPAPMHSHYDASKGGVLQYTRASAYELGAYGIRVNAVAPGLIWREGLEQAWPEGVERWQRTAPLKRLGRAEDVADACLFLASPAARWITGASLTVDGGVLTHQIY